MAPPCNPGRREWAGEWVLGVGNGGDGGLDLGRWRMYGYIMLFAVIKIGLFERLRNESKPKYELARLS